MHVHFVAEDGVAKIWSECEIEKKYESRSDSLVKERLLDNLKVPGLNLTRDALFEISVCMFWH